jgi:hypothetical protein
VIDVLLSNSTLPPSRADQISENLHYLLQKRDGDSQPTDSISFDAFVRFWVRYCPKHDPLATIAELTEFSDSGTSMESQSSFGFPRFRPAGDQFKSWFFPSMDKESARAKLTAVTDEAWVVIQSKRPDTFTLLHKGAGTSQIMAAYIVHDAVAESRDRTFCVNFAPSDRVEYRETIDAILTEVFRLTYKSVIEKVDKGTVVVAPDQIAGRAIEPAKTAGTSVFADPDSQLWFSQVNYPRDSRFDIDSQFP